jgi:hypothetical protein
MVAASLTGPAIDPNANCFPQVIVESRPTGDIDAGTTWATTAPGVTQVRYTPNTPQVIHAGFTERLAARARCTGPRVVPSFRFEVTWAVTEFNITNPVPFE